MRISAVAAAGVALALVTAAPAAADAAAVDRAAQALGADAGVYLDPAAAGRPLDAADAARLRRAVDAAATPVFVAVLGEAHRAEASADLQRLIGAVDRRGTYVVVGTLGFVAGSDIPGVEGRTQTLVQQAIADHRGDPLAELVDFVQEVDAGASGAVAAPAGGQPDRGTGTPPWVPIGVVAGLGVLAAVGLGRRRRALQRQEAEALADVRVAAEEDVTRFGEELTALDVPPSAAAAVAEDYRAALDSYDRAKRQLAGVRRAADVGAVSATLEEGRWRLACTRAGLAGQPPPQRRPPCFFNPQHGPSVTEVDWAPPGGAARPLPVCAADADRLARGDEPDARLVPAGGRLVPYWSGPAYYGPYAGGFFGGWGGGSFLSGLLLGEMLAGPGMGWGADGAGYDPGGSGFDPGFDTGAGDFGGGFDPGGGDFGGGDFGGGDSGGW